MFQRFSQVGSFLLVIGSLTVFLHPQAGNTPQPTEDEGWPRKVVRGDTVLNLHAPTLDSWDGYKAVAHFAFSVQKGEQEPEFGAVQISARTEVDKQSRVVDFSGLKIEKLSFPSDPARAESRKTDFENFLAGRIKSVALDRLEAELAILEAEKSVAIQSLKNDPPRITILNKPGVMVYIDGDPVYSPLPGTDLSRIMNTRVLLVREKSGTHYLHLLDGWLQSPSYIGPWTFAKKPPKDVKSAEQWGRMNGADLLEGKSGEEGEKAPSLKDIVPQIIVATVPTEMIVVDGAPKFVAIEGTRIEFVENTTAHIFKHAGDQKTYLLISGRWFRGDGLGGPWDYVSGGNLPEDFAKIPDDSPKENVKAAIPGTVQAQEAVIAAMIPQTAKVIKAEAKMTDPIFDGAPKLEPIEGTSLQYVVNTATPIVLTDGRYYAVENGIWFVSLTSDGPWTVASSVPPEIYAIPPSNPLHYITYVKIYDTTDEAVFVGYTQGYNGTYISHGSGAVVVYGTGYHYHPWVGTYWYGPPVTYGFGVSITYTPWTGWCYGFGFGWYWGPAYVTVGWGWGAYPWWGPYGWGYPYYGYPRPVYYGAWRGPYTSGVWGPGGWAATTGNVYQRWGNTSAVTRTSGGYNAWTGNRWASQVGMSYNSQTGNLAAGQRAAVGNVYTGNYAYGGRGSVTNTNTGNTVSGGRLTVGNAGTGNSATVGRISGTNPNTGQSGSAGWIRSDQGSAVRVGDSVYAGKDGNVYRKGDSGWEQVNRGGNWSQVQNRSQVQSLERQSQARTQGAQRYQNYRSGSYRSATPRAAPRRGRR